MTPRKPAAAVTRLHLSIKLFVLDANVLMHDPTCLFRFQEHDIYIPMATLEELDATKKGVSEISRNARQASRFLDAIISPTEHDIDQGIALRTHNGGEATGRLFLQTQTIINNLPAQLASGKADNQIIGVAPGGHPNSPSDGHFKIPQ